MALDEEEAEGVEDDAGEVEDGGGEAEGAIERGAEEHVDGSGAEFAVGEEGRPAL